MTGSDIRGQWDESQRPTPHPEINDLIDRLREGMEVRDADGEKVGEIEAVYRPQIGDEQQDQIIDIYLKVKSGFLAKPRYVPGQFISDVGPDHVQIQVHKDNIPEIGFERPTFIPE